MGNYYSAIRECIASHSENNDATGSAALSAMIELPRAEHEAFARHRRGYPRQVCINAIEYAVQECAA